MRVCVIGLGEIGSPTAKYVAKKGFDVQGYDINEIAVKRSEKSGVRATTKWGEVLPAEVYVICVSTLWEGDKPNLTPVFDVCEKISEKIESIPLVSVESTVIPGTCRKIYKNIFRERVALVHVPHRYWAGDPVRYGVKQVRVIGAVNEKSMRRGLRFYSERLKIPLHISPSIEVAEIAKVAENAYRYIQIAYAEELKMVCAELGLNFKSVREACNTKWNIEIFEAQDGIGGHCLPKDIRYLASLGKHNVLSTSATAVDLKYRDYLETKKKRVKAG